MNEQLKSEYYSNFAESIQKYEVIEEAIPYATEHFQGLEEMFLIS